MIKQIVIASGNKDKIAEAQAILTDYEIIPLGIEIKVEEDGETFLENAIKKAETISKKIGNKICIADDSGIQIPYLGGFPGVKTKRWFNGTDRERNLAIIEKLRGIQEKEKRKIKFSTALALSDGMNTITAEASIDGYIVYEPRGENGFGFDEIFELENGKTLAELSQQEKNELSARKKAFEILKNKI